MKTPKYYKGSHHLRRGRGDQGHNLLPEVQAGKCYADYVQVQKDKGEIDDLDAEIALNKNRGGTDYGVMDWATMRLAPEGEKGGWKRTGHNMLFNQHK